MPSPPQSDDPDSHQNEEIAAADEACDRERWLIASGCCLAPGYCGVCAASWPQRLQPTPWILNVDFRRCQRSSKQNSRRMKLPRPSWLGLLCWLFSHRSWCPDVMHKETSVGMSDRGAAKKRQSDSQSRESVSHDHLLFSTPPAQPSGA